MATTTEHKSQALPGTANLAFIEGLYEDYLREPSSVPPDWQRFFAEQANGEVRFSKPRLSPSFRPFSIFNRPTAPPERPLEVRTAALQDRVYLLIRLYRVRGHPIAQVDPLCLPQPVPPELQPEFFGFNESALALTVLDDTFQSQCP